MTNKRDLKAFVRYDGSGRVVAGSLILRKQKPKVGKWTEVQGYQCCNAPVLTSTPADVLPSTNFVGTIVCDTDSALSITFNISSATAPGGVWTTIEEVVSALNMQASYIGTFSVAPNGTDINLNPSFAVAQSVGSCVPTLVFESTYNP
jgi:hypothetical protein